jgi:hypothetical protein
MSPGFAAGVRSILVGSPLPSVATGVYAQSLSRIKTRGEDDRSDLGLWADGAGDRKGAQRDEKRSIDKDGKTPNRTACPMSAKFDLCTRSFVKV